MFRICYLKLHALMVDVYKRQIVHNGIIENYKDIKKFLIGKGYSFISETDTETVAKLLDYYYEGDPIDAIIKTLNDIRGAYALGILFKDFPDKIFAVRKDSPLIIGVGDEENFIASDAVSYTHLDVYKRQGYTLVREENSCTGYYFLILKSLKTVTIGFFSTKIRWIIIC